jgi:hypothetical protein
MDCEKAESGPITFTCDSQWTIGTDNAFHAYVILRYD